MRNEPYLGRMPAAFAAGVQISISLRMNAANSCGDPMRWLETELVHGGLRLGCRQACVDLTIEPIHDVRRRSCREPKIRSNLPASTEGTRIAPSWAHREGPGFVLRS